MSSKKKNIIVFIIISVITLIIFIPFLHKHYATDTYKIIEIGYKKAATGSLADGRVLMAVIGFIAYLLNIPIDLYVLILTIMALFTSCIAVMILKNYILKIKNTDNVFVEILVLLISYFTIFNFLYIENMLFVEGFVMALSIIFYILAAKTLVDSDTNNILKTIIFVCIGTLCYQGTISMYLISLLVFSLIKNKKYTEVLRNLIIGGLILLLGVCFQMLVIKANGAIFHLQQNRVSGMSGIVKNIFISIVYLNDILVYTGYVYTPCMYLIFLALLEIFILVKIYKEKLSIKILNDSILIIFFGILFGLCISFLSTTAFWSARIRLSIGAVIGFLLLYLYYTTDLIYNRKRIINLIIIVTFIIYSITIVVNYINIMNNNISVNKKDKECALEIINYIKDYEKANNIQVNKIAIFHGYLESKAYYKDLKYSGSVLSWSAIRTEWSTQGVLEKYSNRKFTKIEPKKDELEFYIDNVNTDNDYLCINDTLYMGYYVY